MVGEVSGILSFSGIGDPPCQYVIAVADTRGRHYESRESRARLAIWASSKFTADTCFVNAQVAKKEDR